MKAHARSLLVFGVLSVAIVGAGGCDVTNPLHRRTVIATAEQNVTGIRLEAYHSDDGLCIAEGDGGENGTACGFAVPDGSVIALKGGKFHVVGPVREDADAVEVRPAEGPPIRAQLYRHDAFDVAFFAAKIPPHTEIVSVVALRDGAELGRALLPLGLTDAD